MIKQIIHLSDLHIRTFLHHEHYERQFELFLDDVKNKVSHLEYNEIRFALTGDIAHHKINISNEQLLLTSWFLNEITKIGKLVIIPGNHDFLENNLERMDSITPIISLMKNTNISYYKDMGVYEDENIKWVVYSLYQHNQKPIFEKEKDFKYVGLFHGAINGFKTDIGYVFEDAFDRINFHGLDAVLCGDIHKRDLQFLETYDSNTNRNKEIPIVFCGSLIQQNFGESIKNHGYGIYDVMKNKYEFIDLHNEQPYLVFRITDLQDIENNKEVLVNIGY